MMHTRIVIVFLLMIAGSGHLFAQDLPYYRFSVENMWAVNSRFSELSLVPLTDTTYLLVSDRGERNEFDKWVGGTPYDVYTVNRRDYSDIQPVDGMNTEMSDGPATFVSGDEIYLTQTNRHGTVNEINGVLIHHLNISKAVYVNDQWTVEEIPSFTNVDYSFAHPTITPDGNMFFFVSDMPGGLGGRDIYICYRVMNKWSSPVNMGSHINSDQDETFPFYHVSGELYFASRGRNGLGGSDIFVSRLAGSEWSEAENLGEPLNSTANEYAVFFDNMMERGFVTSNRPGGRGIDDVYAIFVDKIYDKPVVTELDRTYTAAITDFETTPLENTEKEEPEELETVIESYKDVTEVPASPVEILDNLEYLEQIMESEGLFNVYFPSGSHTINDDGAYILDRIHTLLTEFSDPVLELHAYADATVSFEENVKLSESRARSVIRYLKTKGVSVDRISYIAYGTANPDILNSQEFNLNRRVEFHLKSFHHHFPVQPKPNAQGYSFKQLPMLDAEKYYVQLAALSQSSLFTSYKLRQYGAPICYVQNDLYKYVLGPIDSFEEAAAQLITIRQDYRDAFIFKNE